MARRGHPGANPPRSRAGADRPVKPPEKLAESENVGRARALVANLEPYDPVVARRAAAGVLATFALIDFVGHPRRPAGAVDDASSSASSPRRPAGVAAVMLRGRWRWIDRAMVINPLLATVLILVLDLITRDATPGGQIAFCAPVLLRGVPAPHHGGRRGARRHDRRRAPDRPHAETGRPGAHRRRLRLDHPRGHHRAPHRRRDPAGPAAEAAAAARRRRPADRSRHAAGLRRGGPQRAAAEQLQRHRAGPRRHRPLQVGERHLRAPGRGRRPVPRRGRLPRPGRADGVVCRLGGDEIAVLLPGADGDTALALAERLVVAVRGAPLRHAGKELPLSVSTGVAYAAEPAACCCVSCTPPRTPRSTTPSDAAATAPGARWTPPRRPT